MNTKILEFCWYELLELYLLLLLYTCDIYNDCRTEYFTVNTITHIFYPTLESIDSVY